MPLELGEELRIELRPAADAIADRDGGVHLLARLTPPPARLEASRLPVAMTLVVDCSGSMASSALGRGRSKLEFAKDAVSAVIGAAREGDSIGLVAFSGSASWVMEPTAVSSETRTPMMRAVSRLQTMGSTNIGDGLIAAYSQLPAGTPTRVVLLTDGHATHGATTPEQLATIAARGRELGVTTSAIGVGLDYQAMALVAVAESGGGGFHHHATPEGMAASFLEELGDAVRTTVRGLQVTVRVAAPAAVRCLNDLPLSRGSYQVGDMRLRKDVVFDIELEGPAANERLEIELLARWQTESGDEREATSVVSLRVVSRADVLSAGIDQEVLGIVVDMIEAGIQADAGHLAERNDRPGAQLAITRHLDGGLSKLDRYGETARGHKTELARRASLVSSRIARNEAGVEKEMLHRAHLRRHSKGLPEEQQPLGPSGRVLEVHRVAGRWVVDDVTAGVTGVPLVSGDSGLIDGLVAAAGLTGIPLRVALSARPLPGAMRLRRWSPDESDTRYSWVEGGVTARLAPEVLRGLGPAPFEIWVRLEPRS